jgi:hypothetical protein
MNIAGRRPDTGHQPAMNGSTPLRGAALPSLPGGAFGFWGWARLVLFDHDLAAHAYALAVDERRVQ